MPQPKVEGFHCGRKAGIEAEHAVPGLPSRIGALHQIHRPGHGTRVDAFRGGAGLQVRHVHAQRVLEQFPGSFRV